MHLLSHAPLFIRMNSWWICGVLLHQAMTAMPCEVHCHKVSCRGEQIFLEGEVEVRADQLTLHAPEITCIGTNIHNLQTLTSPQGEALWISPHDGASHKIICPGLMQWNQSTHRISMQAPEGKRVRWEMPDGWLEARHVDIDLLEEEPSIRRILGHGDVRFQRQDDLHNQLPRLVTAETAEFLWAEQELRLSAPAPKQVHIWNREANQTMSCGALRIWKDPVSREWLHEGQGEVRITLATEQLPQLKNRDRPIPEELP